MHDPKQRKPIASSPRALPKLHDPWMVAAWPGMGTVAALAAHHLLQTLGAEPLALIPEHDFFSIDHVEVHQGIARSGPLPRNMFFVWRDPERKHDLLVFLGEAQPPSGGYQLCQRIIQLASKLGVTRVMTFAAMATHLNPQDEPRVFGAVTAPQLLEELRTSGVELLSDGQISGLNGALLAAAAEKQIPAICLLGEMPFFAASIPNPKSSLAVLNAFAEISGKRINTMPLVEQAQSIEPQLMQLYEHFA